MTGRGITTEEVERLKSTMTAEEWHRECDAIKAARTGEYPGDWYYRIVQSGIYIRAMARWRMDEHRQEDLRGCGQGQEGAAQRPVGGDHPGLGAPREPAGDGDEEEEINIWKDALRHMPYRTACDVLEEMRTTIKTLNFAYLESLIEELQTLANRMEAALDENRDCQYHHERARKAKKKAEEAEALSADLDGIRAELKKLNAALGRAKHAYAKTTKGDTLLCPSCGRTFVDCECGSGEDVQP